MTPPTVLFSSRPDWQDGVKETLAWLTNVITSDNDTEQRISLRGKPRRTIAFTAKGSTQGVPATVRESALLDGLIWGQQPNVIGCPLWQDGVQLASTASIGATSVTVVNGSDGGLVGREFVSGGYMALWSDPFTWEILTVASGSANPTLNCSATTKAWPAGATAVPVVPATLAPQLRVRRPGGNISSVAVEFSCDVLADTAMAVATNPGAGAGVTPWPPVINPAYASSPFLDTMRAFRTFDPVTQEYDLRRSMLLEDSGTGVFGYYTAGASPIASRNFRLKLLSRPLISLFKGILLEVCGRMYPFWTPSRQTDLVLASPALSTDTTLTIQSCGYTENVFPTGPARHYLCVLDPAISIDGLTVTGAVDNGNGTETLTLAGPVGAALPVGTEIDYLLLVRLASDAVTIAYKTSTVADVVLPVAELPGETPAFASFAALGPV
jgi:hypothetical protein